MATTKQEFKDLAAELIDDEFAEFRRSLVFTVVTGGLYDPVTETESGATTTTYTYEAIPKPVDIKEWQGTDIQLTDIECVYTRIDSFEPKVSDTCVYDSKEMQVKAVMLDAADATVKLVMRAL